MKCALGQIAQNISTMPFKNRIIDSFCKMPYHDEHTKEKLQKFTSVLKVHTIMQD